MPSDQLRIISPTNGRLHLVSEYARIMSSYTDPCNTLPAKQVHDHISGCDVPLVHPISTPFAFMAEPLLTRLQQSTTITSKGYDSKSIAEETERSLGLEQQQDLRLRKPMDVVGHVIESVVQYTSSSSFSLWQSWGGFTSRVGRLFSGASAIVQCRKLMILQRVAVDFFKGV